MADFFGDLAASLRQAADSDWRLLARPAQIPPDDFSIWLFMAGRGSGKNWTAGHLTNELAASGAVRRIALLGATSDAVRFTMVEGQSGIMAAAARLGAADIRSLQKVTTKVWLERLHRRDYTAPINPSCYEVRSMISAGPTRWRVGVARMRCGATYCSRCESARGRKLW